jgi:hypothetical protein
MYALADPTHDSWLHGLELVARRPAVQDGPPARLIEGGDFQEGRLKRGYQAGYVGHPCGGVQRG